MKLSNAQYIDSSLMVDDTNLVSEVHHHHHFDSPEDLFKEDNTPNQEGESLEVVEPVEVEIVLEHLPGAPPDSPEPIIEVVEDPSLKVEEEEVSEADDSKKKKNDKWDWEAHGPTGFVAWIKARIDDVPKHSGQDSAGLERACSYLEKLDNEISKAMRLDLDGELDANKIESVRAQIDDGLSRLYERLDKVKKHSKNKRKKKADDESDEDVLIKEAQKITGVKGIMVTVPLFIYSIATVCTRSMITNGRDLEKTYDDLTSKFKLDTREKLALRQLLFDMGLPIRIDMGVLPEEELEVKDDEGYNWGAQYNA